MTGATVPSASALRATMSDAITERRHIVPDPKQDQKQERREEQRQEQRQDDRRDNRQQQQREGQQPQRGQPGPNVNKPRQGG